jgi:pimeloyl-ACP methyl ester carboxylesterase
MELYAREFGQGSPILILHGLFGFSDNWQTIAKALSDHHLVVTPDLRNHGRSPHTEAHSYPEMAEDIRAFMESHWMFTAAVVGHSMGGKVAMQLALEHPDMVSRLVVVDIAPGPAEDKHSGIFRALLDLNLESVATREEIEAYLAERIADLGVRQFLLKNITRKPHGGFHWKMNLPVLWKHFPDILAPVSGPPGAIYEGPALFIRGANSNYIRDSDWPQIQTLFPKAELRTIPNAGHWVHAEQPAAVLAALREFLD